MKHVIPNWTTAEGQIIPFCKVTQQHWSNIYWYHLIFQRKFGMPVNTLKHIVDTAKKQIDKNFKGEILEWRPVYYYEVKWLQDFGMIASGISINSNLEILDGDKKIGTIIPEELRQVSYVN